MTDDEIEAMRARAASKYAGPVGDLDLPNALRVMREVAEELRYEAGRWLATIDAQAKEIADLREALNEARAALNGAPNTVGLHDQIALALKEIGHD